MAPMSILLAALTLISVTLIEAPSHHVQGIDRGADHSRPFRYQLP